MNIFKNNNMVSHVMNDKVQSPHESLADIDLEWGQEKINKIEKLEDLFNAMKHEQAYEDML